MGHPRLRRERVQGNGKVKQREANRRPQLQTARQPGVRPTPTRQPALLPEMAHRETHSDVALSFFVVLRNVVRGNRDVTTRPVFAKNGKQEHVPEEPAALGLMVLKNCGQMLMEMGAVSVKGMMGIGSHKAAAPATNDSGVMAKEGNLWGGRQAVRWGKEDQ